MVSHTLQTIRDAERVYLVFREKDRSKSPVFFKTLILATCYSGEKLLRSLHGRMFIWSEAFRAKVTNQREAKRHTSS